MKETNHFDLTVIETTILTARQLPILLKEWDKELPQYPLGEFCSKWLRNKLF